ncbi:MAG: tetratricopeptide repeat protein [Bdellovibrio sp.]
MKLLATLSLTALFLTGCLQTRNDVRDNESRQVMAQQVTTMQRATADTGNRFSDIEEQIRNLNGRVDIVENKQDNNSLQKDLKNSQEQNAALSKKVDILQESLTKMESMVFQLNTQVNALNASRAAEAAERTAEKAAKQVRKDAYEAAQEFFTKNDWKQAILNYQKYRDENPKGGHFADSTYKIGVSFQELGMKDEAKTFYDEVVSKFPKSEEARRAKIRLKGLKK